MPTRDELRTEALAASVRTQTLEEILLDLQKSELDGALIPVRYGPWTAYQILTACQQVARQPATSEDERAALRVFGDHLATAFEGNQVLADAIKAGWR